MKTVLNPRWLLVVNTLPLVILFLLYFGAYKIINTLLTEENITAWIEIGSSLLVLAVANLIYTFWAILKRQQVSVIYAVTAIFAYITFVYLYEIQSYNIIPPSIPRWMLPTNMLLYVGTFVMPTLTHALLCLIVHSTTEQEEEQDELFTHSSNYSLLAYILPPILWFSLFILIVPFWKPLGLRNMEQHVLVVLAMMGIVIFMFLVGRTVYVLTVKRVKSWQEYSVIFNVIFGIFLPIAALLLNKTLDNWFGNYENDWFYILAACNGVLLSLPELEKPTYRLGLFMARSLSYPFIVYFFLIFLPYAPLAFPLLLALGLGFLLLLPMILMILQTNVMRTDFQYLFNHFPKKFVYAIFGLGILVMPLSVTFSFWQEKQALYQALDYVYEPNLAQKDEEIDKVDAKNLEDVLAQVRQNKENRRSWKNTDIPFISMYYNWLVLDNMTLDEAKIRHLESIFLGYPNFTPAQQTWQQNSTDSTKITKISTNTTYDSVKKQHRTWIDLEITDQRKNSADWRQGEFETVFELPAGVYISDYYLWIGAEKVFGILAEKKAAMWVYRQITATRRDPGILNYVSGNKVRFRVFPFAVGEVRKTGIEILHKEPLSPLAPEGGILTEFPLRGLGGFQVGGLSEVLFSHDKKAAYLSATFKQTLPKVKRKPYLHFIVNCSQSKKLNKADYKVIIQKFIDENKELCNNGKITFTNAYTNTVNIGENWHEVLEKQEFDNGFYVERAIEKILQEEVKNPSNIFPVIFVIASPEDNLIFNKNFEDYRNVLLENDKYYLSNIHTVEEFYAVNKSKKVEYLLEEQYSLLDLKKSDELKLDTKLLNDNYINYKSLVQKWQKSYPEVLAWTHENKNYYLKNDSLASVVNLENDKPFHTEFAEKDWLSGLTLEGQYQTMLQNPHTTEDLWLQLVKGSFDTKIMTPLTSYISLENEAQRQALLYKQQQVLNSKKSLDIPEPDNFQSMSEPSWWLCVIILLGLLAWKKKHLLHHIYTKIFFLIFCILGSYATSFAQKANKDSIDFYVEYANKIKDSLPEKSEKIALEYLKIASTKQKVTCYTILSIITSKNGKRDKSIEYCLEALKIVDNEAQKPEIYNLIAGNYNRLGQYSKALDYAKKSLEIAILFNDTTSIARAYNIMGNISEKLVNYSQNPNEVKENKLLAIKYYTKALELYKQKKILRGVAILSNNLGNCYLYDKEYEKSLALYEQAIATNRKIGNYALIGFILNNIANIYTAQKKHQKAIVLRLEAADSAKKYRDIEAFNNLYSRLANDYHAIGDDVNAFKYMRFYHDSTRKLFTENQSKVIAEMQTKYDTEKKQQEIELLTAEKDLDNQKLKQKNVQLGAGIIVLVLLTGFSFTLYKNINQKKQAYKLLKEQNQEIISQKQALTQKSTQLSELNEELHQTNEELASTVEIVHKQNAELEKKKSELTAKNIDITASINYAKRIQNALLPEKEEFFKYLPQSFVLYFPKDIVSGDFYYIANLVNRQTKSEKIIVVAADCTGHGVPGAFMSMIGISLLNELVYQNGYSTPNVILRRLHKGIQTSLRQQQNDSKDGMDIIAISLVKDEKNMSFSEVEYSGAMNPLYYTQLDKTTQVINLHEIKADKMPLGGMMGESEATFTKHTIDLTNQNIETTLYLCSDGYQDQFGGEKGKKFMVKRLRELLLETATKSLPEQEQILANTFWHWKAQQEQVDDVMVLGIRV